MSDPNANDGQRPYQQPNSPQSSYIQPDGQQYASPMSSTYAQQPYQQSAQPGATYPPQGVYQQGTYGYPVQQQPSWNGMCIAGFICSFLTTIVGLILSIVGLRQVRQSGEKGQGLAVAGIVISVVRVVLILVLVVLVYIGFAVAWTEYGDYLRSENGYDYDYGGDYYDYYDDTETTSAVSHNQLDMLIASTYEACLAA